MKIQFLKSATTVIESNGVKILTDPWLVDGEYYGSWFHYPPFEFNPSDFDDIDFIYISHIHPDHFSRATLKQLNNKIPVLIHDFSVKFLKRNLESLGFEVTELENNCRTHLKNGVHVNIFAADNCNPELCMKHFGCGGLENKFGATQIDSLSVIDDGKFSVLNVNDCPFGLASHCEPDIRAQYGAVDLMLVGYAGAGPYPQCISNLSQKEKEEAAVQKQNQFIDQGVSYLKLFKPKSFMPFAGTYTLGGSYWRLNDLRGVPEIEDALQLMQQDLASDETVASHGFLLNSGESFDLNTQAPSNEYQPIDRAAKVQYIETELATKQFTFESDPQPTLKEITDLLGDSHNRMNKVRNAISFETDTAVLISLPDNKTFCTQLKQQSDGVVEQQPGWRVVDDSVANEIEPSVRFKVDPRLLLRILKGPKYGHWNNAEIGSHIQFERKPEKFERGLYYCMNFFYA